MFEPRQSEQRTYLTTKKNQNLQFLSLLLYNMSFSIMKSNKQSEETVRSDCWLF